MVVKKVFDIITSILFIILLLPLFIIIAIFIKGVMPGPIFFVQQRIGKAGHSFRLIKFRTMLVVSGKKTSSFDVGDTSRISSFGKILRKTKLDELPQLINVFKGDMSIVGPRPEVKEWTEVYPEKWEIVHSVKPGITDNASIEFRNEEEILAQSSDPTATYRDIILPRKLNLYIDYVNNQSFFGDIKIILNTIKAVIIK